VINAVSAYCDQQIAWKTINHADGSLCDGTWTQQSNSENIRFTNGKNDLLKKRAQLSVTTLRLIGDDCPTATDTILIKLNPNPILSKIPDQLGCAPLSAIWTVDELNNLSPDQVTYSWALGSGKISSQQIPGKINYDIPGKFNIRVIATSDSGNCADTNLAQVFVYPKPMAAFSTNPENPTVAMPKIQMINQSTIDTNNFNHKLSYRWDFGNTNQNSDTSLLRSPYYHYGKDTGKFNITLIVTSPYNCSDTAIKSIYIKPSLSIYIPNAFTPNNTGPSVNNTFKPITGSYLKAQFSIYNRWGEKLFETNNLTNGWDGKSNGQDCEEGTYLYKLVIFDKDFQSYQYHGTFTLLR
jgi:gliding motility-associated-like protein